MSARIRLPARRFARSADEAAILGLFALVVVGAGLAGRGAAASPPPPAPPAPPAARVLGPASEDTPFGQRMRMHRAEAEGRHHHGLPDLGAATAFSATAANFGALFEQEFRVEHQVVTVEVAPQTPGLAVDVTATLTVLESGLASLSLRSEKVVIQSLVAEVQSGGAILPAKATYGEQFGQIGVVQIKPAAPLQVGDVVVVRARWTATLDCNKQTTLLRTCTFDNEFWQVLFFRLFFDHATALHAPHTSTLHIVTPADRVAAAPGTPLGSVPLADGRLRWGFEQTERTEHGGFSIAKYAITGTGPKLGSSVPWLRLLTLGTYQGAAKGLLSSVDSMLGFYGQRFGAFPWSGLSIIQVANNFGGGYAPLSGIFMLRNIFGAQAGAGGWTSWNELAAHEVAHQWWGNYARPMATADVCLSESLAEYSSCLYTEHTLKSRAQLVEDNLSYVYTVSPANDRPLASATVYQSPAYVQIVYHKGAAVFEMLRHEVGEAVLAKGLAAFAVSFGRDYARVSDLRAAVEKASGRDLGWFFKQWFQQTGSIEVELAARMVTESDGSLTLRLRVAQLSKVPMRFRLPLRLTFADGEVQETSVEVEPPLDGFVTVVTLPLSKRPLIVRPDVNRTLLRQFVIIDGADVTLDGLVDGVDLMECAFRRGRRVVWKGNFFPSASWDELFDADGSYVIDDADMSRIFEMAGEEVAVVF